MSVRRERQAIPIEPIEEIDPAVESALGKPPVRGSIYERLRRAKEMTPAQRRKAERDRNRSKETFDLPEWLVEAVAQIAETHGVPKSNVAAHLLAAGLKELLNGQINLDWMKKASRSPRYEGLLEAPERIENKEIEKYCNEHK